MEGQWFPGNMAKAMEQLRSDLKIIDLVVELIDARVPVSSSNPTLGKLIGGKNHLVLLHKADRGDQEENSKWLAYFRNRGKQAILFSVHEKESLNKFKSYLKQQEEKICPARLKRPLRLMIVGIPNVGKSTLINHIVRRTATRTGNQPGITRGRQWIKIMPGIELLDTPGVLWPKIEEMAGYPLAAVGAMPVGRMDSYEVACWLIASYLEQERMDLLAQRYAGLKAGEPEDILEQVGRMLGCLIAGGKVDYDRASTLFLKDFQGGALGRLTLEKAPDGEWEEEEVGP